jgi:hypothetical protein
MQTTANNAYRLKSSACHRATTSSRSRRAPPRSARCRQDSKLELVPLTATERAPGKEPLPHPARATGSARLAAPQPSAGAQAKEDLARERAVARMQERQLAHKAGDAGIAGQPGEQNPAGGDPVPGVRAASWQACPDVGHDPLMPLPGPGDCWDGREDAAPGPSAGARDRHITPNDRQLGENARGAADRCAG